MGKRCVVACCNNTHKQGVSLFGFPQNKVLRMKWIKAVQRTRAEWKDPGKYSCICSEHFTIDCFEQTSVVSGELRFIQLPKNENLGKLGLNWKKQLKPNAIPTIFPRTTATSSKSRHSCAFEKRERARVTKTLQFDGSIMLFLKGFDRD